MAGWSVSELREAWCSSSVLTSSSNAQRHACETYTVATPTRALGSCARSAPFCARVRSSTISWHTSSVESGSPAARGVCREPRPGVSWVGPGLLSIARAASRSSWSTSSVTPSGGLAPDGMPDTLGWRRRAESGGVDGALPCVRATGDGRGAGFSSSSRASSSSAAASVVDMMGAALGPVLLAVARPGVSGRVLGREGS